VLALDSDDPAKGRKIVEEAARLAGVAVAFSNNITRDFAEAALFVYITESEGLGSAALLAMANGVPVIASRVGGLPEIVQDGVTGILTSNEPQEVARQIQRVMSDEALADRLAARARERVASEFSTERMVNDTVRVYEKILNCSKLA
jgi:glycosyltransferase involved in cell wall biosynthesis